MTKLALKRLTASDLTFFQWHFRNNPAGNQKAINLNRNVFIDVLYPSLPDIAAESDSRIPLDVFFYGPGLAGELNLQRKIVKGDTYKNWRLNGEFVYDPEDSPKRFHLLQPGDFALFAFSGDLRPVSARVFLIARDETHDSSLHAELERVAGGKSMISLEQGQLERIIKAAGLRSDHPVRDLSLDDALEDAALNGIEGIRRLRERPSGRSISQGDLDKVRRKAERVGKRGEELFDVFLRHLQKEGKITSYEWISRTNAVAPHDFEMVMEEQRFLLDVKSTEGEFDRPIHISLNELLQMSSTPGHYHLVRVYELTESTAKFRLARDMTSFADSVLETLRGLPDGVALDSISVNPSKLNFDPESTVDARAFDEPEE